VPLETEKDVIINENRSIAEKNLQLEPKLIELRSRINDLSGEGKALCASVQEKLAEISKPLLTLSAQSKFNNLFFRHH
jgi:ESCRT-I complex subunit VPS37